MKIGAEDLAIHGGAPIRSDRNWPTWPDYDASTENKLLAALRSNRWSVSWHSTGRQSLEREFAAKFAQYNGSAHCVSVDHGSSALLIALETLDLGPEDEVIVPVLTWVAPATAVLRAGAVPILVDVDPRTGCLDTASLSRALTGRTKAIIVVHLACTIADLDTITAMATRVGATVIEDCSQAHGAQWGSRRVGTIGAVGVFSLGAAKTLAGGEGGAVITDDPDRYLKLQMLRADSRRYHQVSPEYGEAEIIEDGAIMGANYCMSEFSAGVLLDQLERLEKHNNKRSERAYELEQILADLDIADPIPVPAQVTRRSIYEYAIQISPRVLRNNSINDLTAAVSAELGVKVYPPRAPLHRSVLLRPETIRRYHRQWSSALERGGVNERYVGADAYVARTMLFHHSLLLGTSQDVKDIVTAIKKVCVIYSRN